MRHNYHPSPLERLAALTRAIHVPAQLRIGMAMVGMASLLVSIMWGVETRRIAVLEHELAIASSEARAIAADARRAQSVAGALRRAVELQQRIDRAHRVAIASTNAIALLGNGLPSDTWLTSLATAPSGSINIAGRSARVEQIGTALRAIQHIDAHAGTRLISISATGRTGRIHDFLIGWDRHP